MIVGEKIVLVCDVKHWQKKYDACIKVCTCKEFVKNISINHKNIVCVGEARYCILIT